MTNLKIYNSPPLPFIGQKRNFIKEFRSLVHDLIEGEGDGWTIVDVFGGSGLLAHNAKRLKPKARVIFNDFDGYADKIKRIQDTERLRTTLLSLVKDCSRNSALPETVKNNIIQAIKTFDGFVDVVTLSAWLLFSGKNVLNLEKLFNNDFYHRIRKSPIKQAEDYLEGLEITHDDFRHVMKAYSQEKTLFILDPPYLYTDERGYKKGLCLKDFLDLIDLIKPPFIFFSSHKSDTVPFLDYIIDKKTNNYMNFQGYQKLERKNIINTVKTAVAHYVEYMIWKS